MKKNILIFPCGSEIGLEINNALKYSTRIELFGASSVKNHGKFVYKNYIGNLPDINSKKFIEKLNQVIKKYRIDIVFPAHDSVVLKLAESKSSILCKIIGSSAETCKICRSKSKTYRKLKGVISVPELYDKNNIPKKFPVFLKPDSGQGSKGTYIANSVQDIEFYTSKDQTLITLEYLPGEEYTIDCFTDKNGVLKFAGARKRERVSNGISVNTYPVEDARFKKIAKKINDTLSFRGAWFFQLKRNIKGNLSLLEIAPRIAGSMALYRNLGINFTLLSVFDALDFPVSITYNHYDIELDRALFNRFYTDLHYGHVYIDLDDTIIFENKVNLQIIMFLYQCRNEKIKIHLLSRHEARFHDNIQNFLIKHKILEIFDSIINLGKGEKKSRYIAEKNSIFIDDSFAERSEVAKSLKIPTFDINSVESLINWKN